MSFWKNIFPFSLSKTKKKKEYPNIILNVDPNTLWETTGELGDGSFGKVYKVCTEMFPIYLYNIFKDLNT